MSFVRCSILCCSFRQCLHEQKKPSLIAQILDPYAVTPEEFAQINVVLFAHVNTALYI